MEVSHVDLKVRTTLIVRNKWHHRKVLLYSIYLNGHTFRFYPWTGSIARTFIFALCMVLQEIIAQ